MQAVLRGLHVILPLSLVKDGVELDAVNIEAEVRFIDDTGTPATLESTIRSTGAALAEAIRRQCDKWEIDTPTAVESKVSLVDSNPTIERELRRGTHQPSKIKRGN